MIPRPRVIVALPDLTECGTIAECLIANGFEPIRRASAFSAAEEMNARPFDLLIADTQLAFNGGLHATSRQRNPQAPTVVIGNSTAEPPEARSGQTMYLSRPIDRALLICFVSMAIAEGRPVRKSARKPVNRFAAVANGVPSHIVDISNEGLRLEVPQNRRAALPPYFSVQVPLLGVALAVQRMWTRPSARNGGPAVTWYGGALALNRAQTETVWRTLVETIPVGRNRATLEQID